MARKGILERAEVRKEVASGDDCTHRRMKREFIGNCRYRRACIDDARWKDGRLRTPRPGRLCRCGGGVWVESVETDVDVSAMVGQQTSWDIPSDESCYSPEKVKDPDIHEARYQ